MILTIKEIRLILETLGDTYDGFGFSPDPKVGKLQAKLSIMLEVKVVTEQARAKEARFQEEHDGMSSAEFYGEAGYADAQDEARREAQADEDEHSKGGP